MQALIYKSPRPLDNSGEDCVALLDRVKSKDVEALETLYVTYKPMVYRIALRTGRSDADAAEIVQDVFFELWRNPPDLRNYALQTWLIVKTKSFCWKRFHREQRRPKLEAISVDHGYKDSQLEAVDLVSLRTRLTDFFGDTESPYKQLVIMAYYCDMRPTEIAELLEIPVATVRKRLNAAIRILQRCIARRRTRRW